ncbi:DUF4132 domain-containing protein [Neobacillus cucumis]|uniref:DUF4132 domain-containing protein n=1 Tax=Neobacillus cucumis TaxID=1740721 RepID=UPI001963E21A|nr:DUF5724 domain-containing protein [Neobacillus cucumis]MBM7650995.1 hypothetical protein [Neobacillus cucumis]
MKHINKNAYFEKLDKKAGEAFSGTELQTTRMILKVIKSPDQQKENYIRALKKNFMAQSSWRDTDFFEPFIEIARALLGQEYGDLFQYITQHKYEYPYSVGYERRPFRTTNLICHMDGIIESFSDLFELDMENFSIMKYLTEPGESWEYQYQTVISDYIAFELDRNNEIVFQALKDIMFGENNTALLTLNMIKGMLKSHSQACYQMLGDLLLAARLQEGLRQSIVESMDEGTAAAAIYLLKIILEHDLIRYSSVLRALSVWTGLNLEAANKRVASQLMQDVLECLTNSQLRREGHISKNSNSLYISLWAAAFYEEEQVRAPIIRLMENGASHQKAATQFFLTQSQNRALRFELSYPYLDETNHELQCYLITNYGCNFWSSHTNSESKLHFDRLPLLEDKAERTRHFKLFKKIFLSLPKKELLIESKAVHGITTTFSTDDIAIKMLYLTAYDLDKEWVAQLMEWKDRFSSNLKETLLHFFIKDYTDPTQREFLFACLSDRSIAIRETALRMIKSLELSNSEVEKIGEVLKLKTGSLRQSAIRILSALSLEKLETALERLLGSGKELQRMGALEILSEIKDQQGKDKLINTFKNQLQKWKNASTKEQILIDKLLQEEAYTPENGFGLFDPKRQVSFELSQPINSLKDYFSLPTESIKPFLRGLADIIHEHRHVEYEVEWYGGHKETLHIGEELRLPYTNDLQMGRGTKLEQFPLSEVWKDYLNSWRLTPSELVQIAFYLNSERIYRYYAQKMNAWELYDYPKLDNWKKSFLEDVFPFKQIAEINQFVAELDYRDQVKILVTAFFEDQDAKRFFEEIYGILIYLIHSLPKKKTESEYRILDVLTDPWLEWGRMFSYKEEKFEQYFKVKYQLFVMTRHTMFHPSIEELARAYQRKLIDEQVIFQMVMGQYRGRHVRQYLSELTDPKRDTIKKYPFMEPIKDMAVKRIVDIELKRGDLPTKVTAMVGEIERFEGMEYFVGILSALEKEPFVRGYLYVYGDTAEKKEVLSHLLKACYPHDEDNEEKLSQLIKGKNISEKRLLEAAMYAPQWLAIVEKYLQWDGLSSAAWYFHAHVNEFFSEEKETMVARYSPISPKDFQDGAFDIRWFQEAFGQLGEERFQILYQCAKYISGGANHRRSQLFADAVLGKLKQEETKNSVKEKRNKDQLLCYSLIPVKHKQDVLERYEFLQQFLKESKNFGAQRRASESKTVDIALENLARNASYQDVTRLKWEMEAKKLEQVHPYLEPKGIDDLTVQLVIDENGLADILTIKNAKPLKSVPSKYNKHEYIVTLKAIKADLREQYKRAKKELEHSMVLENSFTLNEVTNMMGSPVLAPLLKCLVLMAGKRLGYYEAGSLKNVETGESYLIQADDDILIAHPIHLYESGQWGGFQRDLFVRKVKQPFKQVFRELYLPNQDELASGAGTKRYAGHQIQPKKTAALLKTKMWTVSYEEGLQKVYHKENIVVKLYAVADWLSPSDIESPVLETVEFFDRQTDRPIEIHKIPKHTFSETMRDIDLVVSIAHVGGVDPEASLTTIEMRKAIAAESIRLMKLDNVRIEGNFALINGIFGEYSVHLGSGNVYKQATGAIFIIPVHSQQRGRIFLPFMDEDPKTAEIISKILMFSEDKKIKDPFILEQIAGVRQN